MRSFPSAPWLRRAFDRLPPWAHPQWLITAVAVLVAVAGLAVPLAHADDRDDLKDRQNRVQGKIESAKDHVHESSARAARINRQLTRSTRQLTGARNRLESVRKDLTKARGQAARLATALATAEKKLAVARENLQAAVREVNAQKDTSRGTIIGIATGEDPRLALMSAYADGRSIEEVLRSKTANDMLVGRQQQALDDFVVAEDRMRTRRAEVKSARDEVASAKKAADANVARVATLVRRAATTRSRVAGLVDNQRSARRAAIAARAADRAALRRLEAREARIRSRILALSRAQGGSYNGSTGGLLARPGPGPVTSPFGYRVHPIYGYYGLHNGTDFGTGCGAQLWAGESGTVIDTYYDEVYGNRLYLAIGRVNGASITLVYNHLSGYAVGEGARVKRGQVVGYSGTTGWSTGCHLHFTVLRNGQPVDPMQYM